jgi:undecaprenyl-diphosphatase
MNAVVLTLSTLDERLLVALLRYRRPRVDTAMRLLTKMGNWYVIVPVTLALTLGAVPGLEGSGTLALWALVGSHLIVQLLKRGFCRERPRLPAGFQRLIEPEDRFAFPSGHATAGLAVGLGLFIGLSGPVAFAVLGLGLMIGVSRCYLGVHYPGDVMSGWALAVVSVVICALAGVGL